MTENLLDTVHINFDTRSLWTMNLVLGFVMFGVALEISISDFKRLWKNPRSLFIGLFSQFVLLPAITFLLVLCIAPMPSIALGMFMVAACPGGTISNFMAYLAKADIALSVSLTGMATLLALVMTPLNFQFWSMLYAPSAKLLKNIAISPVEMGTLVSLLLGLPVAMGMIVNYYRPVLASKMARTFKLVSLLFFIFLITIALYRNRSVFMEAIVYVFWIVLIHNLIAFFAGYGMSSLLRLPEGQIRSITIETGIQNSGLGLLLIFTFSMGWGEWPYWQPFGEFGI